MPVGAIVTTSSNHSSVLLFGSLRFAFLQPPSGIIKRWKQRFGKDNELARPWNTTVCNMYFRVYPNNFHLGTWLWRIPAGYTKTRKKRIPRAFRGKATSVFPRFFLRNGSGFYSTRIECECATRAYAMRALLFLFTSTSLQNRRWWTIVRTSADFADVTRNQRDARFSSARFLLWRS